MINGEALTGHIMKEVMAFDPDHAIPFDDIVGALLTCVVEAINTVPNRRTRARMVIAALSSIVQHTDADLPELMKAMRSLSLSDVEGSA